jgi:hypothetical protein
MLRCGRKLLEARAKHGIPTASRQWDAVLRRGYAEGAFGSEGRDRRAGANRRDQHEDEDYAQYGSPQGSLIRKIPAPDDTTGRFEKDWLERSVNLGTEDGTTHSRDAEPYIKKHNAARPANSKIRKHKAARPSNPENSKLKPPFNAAKGSTTHSKDAEAKVMESPAVKPANRQTGKPKLPPRPKTRWGTRELVKDASFGVVTTSRPLATTIDDLVKEIPPMPQDEASGSPEDTVTLVLLMTPGLARYALDITVPNTVVRRLRPSKLFGKKYTTTAAIVDRLPTTNDEIGGAEGMAYMLFRNAPSAEDGDQVPFQGSAQKPGSLTFQMPRVSHDRVWKQVSIRSVQLPLSQTVFTTGLVSTMILREYTHSGIDEPMELTSERKLESQTLRLPTLSEGKSSRVIYVPLVPLTPFRKINYVMGNIIRKLSAQRTWDLQPNENGESKLIEIPRDNEQDAPASQDLEEAVSKYFEVLDLQPETVSVWALVMPKTADSAKIHKIMRGPAVSAVLAADEAAICAAWDPKADSSKNMSRMVSVAARNLIYHGARLIKVLSGGGGWGKKAGLLSLDPDVQYSTRELRQDEGWQFDFDAPEDGTGAAVEAQKNQALGQIVKEGESIMFLLAPKLKNLPLTYSEAHHRDNLGLRTPSELEVSFGAIPSSIDEVAQSSDSDATPTTIQHYPNFFGMLSEGGMAFQYNPAKEIVFQSKMDVPFGRFTYKYHMTADGQKLKYYPDAHKKGDAGPKSSAIEAWSESSSVFRGKADVEQRTAPL